jgi:hypothetical protein
MIRRYLGMPLLRRSLSDTSDATYEELDELFLGAYNTVPEVADYAIKVGDEVITGLNTLHGLNYQIGQGVRPENVYVELREPGGFATADSVLYLNTELVVSPAVVLLQKMQAANQALFDLAGQGFLYLDAESTPEEILGAYHLASTAGNEEERRICNNAGACQLLDPWLKPAASFRSVASIGLGTTAGGETDVPLLIGPGSGDIVDSDSSALLGSGLPAPWEDESTYLEISNEGSSLSRGGTARRYTVGRFRNALLGLDEADDDTLKFSDNIGSPFPGSDWPVNDWYDRVFELYESGIGAESSGREGGSGVFALDDWECYIALWFREKIPGDTFVYDALFTGIDGNLSRFNLLTDQQFCGEISAFSGGAGL